MESKESYVLRKIKREELHLVRDFAPLRWNLNVEKVYSQHFDEDYFYSVVAGEDKAIIGTGMAIVNDKVSWLGTIIVPQAHQKKGIGTAITKHLVQHSKTKGAISIILTASDEGYPIYKKMGFEHDLYYLVLKIEQLPEIKIDDKFISQITEADYDEIAQLDATLTGEKRRTLLNMMFTTGYKYKEKSIEGYYLPHCGKGLIAATTVRAGIELLKLRLSMDPSSVCLPERNKAGIDFLKSLGFEEVQKIPRMFLGSNVAWKPDCIYIRGSGYLG